MSDLDDVFGQADGSYGDMWVNDTAKKVIYSFGDWEGELAEQAYPLVEAEFPGYKVEGEAESGDPRRTYDSEKQETVDAEDAADWRAVYQKGERVGELHEAATPPTLPAEEADNMKPKRPTFKNAQPRSALIASYGYGPGRAGTGTVTGFTTWGEPVEVYADVSKEERENSKTMKDGSYPIKTCSGEGPSVDSAIHAVGRGSGDHDAIRKHIIEAARDLGCANKIPDNWGSDGSIKESSSSAQLAAGAPCPTCEGSGKIREGKVECPDCEGTGKKPAPDLSLDPVTASAVTDALREQGLTFTQIIQALVHQPPGKSEGPSAGPVKTTLPSQDGDKPAPDDKDAKVDTDLESIKDAVKQAIVAQEADMDGPADEKVLEGLKKISQTLTEVIGAQGADENEDEPAEKPPVTAAAPPAADVDNEVKCANCDHMASAHADGDDGANTGGCAMAGCDCPAMQVGKGVQEKEGEQEANAELATPGAPAPGAAPAPVPAEDSDLNAPPEVPSGENMGPAFTIPVAVIEGQMTSDERQIAPGGLTWRTPPLPLMGLATSTHDPAGIDMNDPAVICGRIDSFSRDPGEGDTQIISAHGFYLNDDNGAYFASLTESFGRCGISADVAVQATEITGVQIDEMGFPEAMNEIISEGTIMALTQVPMAAFEGAYIVLGDGTEQPEPIPQAHEEPIAAAAIHFMTYEECESCDQGFDVITAAGGPSRPPMAWFENPNFCEGDGRLQEILDKRGKRVMGGKYACPITVTDDGRIFGHLAPWDVCHTGFSGKCIIAPRSKVDYAHFKRGQYIVTAEGEQVRVGVITADTGHSSTRRGTPGFSAAEAMAHYDNTALQCADVNIGEDEYGIWIAGAVRPEATEEQIRKLRASSLSGDWRGIGGRLELVAALAVNQPGYPLAVVSDGHQEALVAAGTSIMDRLKHPLPEPPAGDTALRAAVAPLLDEARSRARERIGALG